MANDLLYKAILHLGASPQNKRSSLLYKIPTVGNRQQQELIDALFLVSNLVTEKKNTGAALLRK
jgi:hypothetical protein